MKLSLQWKWFLGLAALLVVLLAVAALALDLTLPSYLRERIRVDLERDAHLARAALAGVPADRLNAETHRLAAETGLRLTVIASNGVVVAESDRPPAELGEIENHLTRPEVQEAQLLGVGWNEHVSRTVQDPQGQPIPHLYVAVRTSTGFVRVAYPLRQIAEITGRVRRAVAGASLAVALVALPLVFFLARRISRPLEVMRRMAVSVAGGDFSARAPARVGGELGELARALDQMSVQLETRLRELAAEKAELNATLANMIEGVLVVDAAGRIRLANTALRQQFQLSDAVLGKTVLEAFRNTALHDLMTQALATEQAIARELTILGAPDRVFDISAARLLGHGGTRTGTVVVFHDITRIKKLENVRKDFVANVSHELRTPLSIIKGYLETLLDQPAPDDATRREFLETIQRHSNRLEALIEDLLHISELESQPGRLALAPVSLRATAEVVLAELAQRVAERQTIVTVDLPEAFPPVRADAQRLHQVFFNLLDNAIKFTPAGGRVTVTGKARETDVEICVADTGPGIAPEHQARIFERFYRVDKARSRELGGTGLGLSIVKHIVQAHGGRVWVESLPRSERGGPGPGSRFYFTLPRA